MAIEPTYTMLLGRPWIHSANAIPLTLHQKIKYVIDGKIIIVRGEEAMLVTKPQSVPYVETTEQALESSFQTLELQEVLRNNRGATDMVAKVMLKNGYEEGKRLGTRLQGIVQPITVAKKEGRFGLGFDEGDVLGGKFGKSC